LGDPRRREHRRDEARCGYMRQGALHAILRSFSFDRAYNSLFPVDVDTDPQPLLVIARLDRAIQ
jgi:hypothetical protein